jgi:hypothetical protein
MNPLRSPAGGRGDGPVSYVLNLPSAPSFEGKGLRGFAFGLRHPQLDIHFVDVAQGHDTYMISKCVTRIYYVLEGEGSFTIENKTYRVRPRVLIEVPPNLEYSYSGTMKLLLIGTPRWFLGNERMTRKNPDVHPGTLLERFLGRLAAWRPRTS